MYKSREKYLAAHRKYNEAHREERRILTRIWKLEHPDKVKEHNKKYSKYRYSPYKRLTGEKLVKLLARKSLQRAVKRGTVKKKPCFCGETKVEGHHTDYSKRHEVIWLCNKHHRERHRLSRNQ